MPLLRIFATLVDVSDTLAHPAAFLQVPLAGVHTRSRLGLEQLLAAESKSDYGRSVRTRNYKLEIANKLAQKMRDVATTEHGAQISVRVL